MQKNRIIYLDILKALAVFSVIMIHVCTFSFKAFTWKSPDWKICCFLDAASRFAVPVFLMVSGALLLSPEKQETFKDIWNHRIKRILIIFAVWSFLYALSDFIKWGGL